MNAEFFVLENKTEELKKYLLEAYSFLIKGYDLLIPEIKSFKNYNENKLRDELVMKAKKIKGKFNILWKAESINLEKSNRIDIELITIDSLKDDTKTIGIECKIISSDKIPDNINKYIDSKKTFPKTNGIMSFITGKYAENMSFAGMIGFVKEGNIIEKIEKIKEALKKTSDIITIKNLDNYEIEKSFNYSYISKHSRAKKLGDIDIYHLFFDFTN